jgi:hypothetical protein
MSDEDTLARVNRLEARLRNTDRLLAVGVIVFAGYACLQHSGYFALRGSSLQVDRDGQPVFAIDRMRDDTTLFLYDAKGRSSFSVNAGGVGPSLHLTHSEHGGGIQLSAGGRRAMVALWDKPDDRRVFLSTGDPELGVFEGEDAAPRPPTMPGATVRANQAAPGDGHDGGAR